MVVQEYGMIASYNLEVSCNNARSFLVDSGTIDIVGPHLEQIQVEPKPLSTACAT